MNRNLAESILMASYQLIKEEGEVSGKSGDVESALHKINNNNPSSSSPAPSGSGCTTSSSARLVSLDIFRGITVVQCIINSPDYGPLPPDAPSWCQAPFDPEGCLSTVMAIVTCFIGLQYGHIIVHFKEHKRRLVLWLAPSACFIVVGMLCDILGMHINKALYSFSYMCVTGIAGILLAAIYLVVDMYGYRRFTMVLESMGMNALLIYILVACNILPLILQGFYWRYPSNNILTLIGIGKQAH